jgi:hypothetical protein
MGLPVTTADRKTASRLKMLLRRTVGASADRVAWRLDGGRNLIPARTARHIADALPQFRPASAGDIESLAELTLRSANQVLPHLARLAAALGRAGPLRTTSQAFAADATAKAAAARLKVMFDAHGSDKASKHDYHLIYGAILSQPDQVGALLEIGLGSNNEDVVSNMGSLGRPGASLRAFRDFLPRARIVGADVDRRILFEEERIRTFFVDQTDLESIGALGQAAGADFDLIIDDGLHSPNANLAVLLFALERLRRGGWLIVEDIAAPAAPLWQVTAALMPDWSPQLIETRNALVFAVQRP